MKTIEKVLSAQAKESLKLLNGCEVWSNHYGECVGIKGNEVIAAGFVIDTLDTEQKINVLFAELVEQEGV